MRRRVRHLVFEWVWFGVRDASLVRLAFPSAANHLIQGRISDPVARRIAFAVRIHIEGHLPITRELS